MTRQRTFSSGGWIVSVVPAEDVHQVRGAEEAQEVVRSAEDEGGTDLLFDILGHWGPRLPVGRDALRALVVKELLGFSVLLRRPSQEAVAYRPPEAVDLRDLIDPVPLGSDTNEPNPPQSVVEPEPWIEFTVVDSKGRALDHFSATLRSNPEARSTVLNGSVVREEGLPSASPTSVVLEAAPERQRR